MAPPRLGDTSGNAGTGTESPNLPTNESYNERDEWMGRM